MSEGDRARPDHQRASPWWWLASAPIAYLVPFILVLLDEVVLKTRFDNHLPRVFGDVFKVVYAPLIRLVELLLR